MGRYASDTGGGFKPAPEGTHIARAYQIVDIGTQHGDYQGTPTVRNQLIVRWELPLETEKIDGVMKPLIVSKFYTNSLSPKANLRQDLESWRGRAFNTEELIKFDLMGILGKPCTITIVHTEGGKAKIVSVAALPKGSTCPPQFNKSIAFWIDEWDEAAFRELPAGFQRLITESDEYKKMWEKRDRLGPAEGSTVIVGGAPDLDNVDFDEGPPF